MDRRFLFNEFNKHYYQIEKGGFKIFLSKLINVILKSYKILFFLISLILIFILLLISIFKNVKIGNLRTDKIGEFAIRCEIYLLKNKNNKDFHIIFRQEKISNLFLFNLYKKKILFYPYYIFNELYILINLFNFKNLVYDGPFDNIDSDLLLKKFRPQINIPNEFKKKFYKFKNIFNSKKRKIVCITIRDNAYYGKSNLTEYRNSDIKNCKRGINYLIQNGYFVIRMGRLTQKKLNIKTAKKLSS